MKQVPATTPESDALAKQLAKLGFKFVGSTIVYAFLQAIGAVDDHLVGCFRHGAERQRRSPVLASPPT
jgi:DNA-3-methyladenine glycosylase I